MAHTRRVGSGLHSFGKDGALGPGGLLLVVLLATGAMADAWRDQIEAEWQRQDHARLEQIRQPSLVRFPQGHLAWPGVKPDDRLRVPVGPRPVLDGRLDEPCWQRAACVAAAAPDHPVLRLVRDDQWLYAAVSLPTSAEAGYQGCPTALDAAGAVDGVKNGKYAFHTNQEPNPWWQVDLGARHALGKIVVYNRLDYAPGLHNADHLVILASDDAKTWTRVYDNQGKFFGGMGHGGPLVVEFGAKADAGKRPVEARFVRLQVPSAEPVFFHLDEVEIYSAADPSKNIALRRPARQSSLSIWSRGGRRGGSLFTVGRRAVTLAPDAPSGVAVGGAPCLPEQAQLRRDGGQTCLEMAIPLADIPGRFPSEILRADGAVVRLAAGRPWRLVWPETPRLGFGAHRLALRLEASGPIDPPLRVTAETVVFTPLGAERQVVLDQLLAVPAEIPLEFQIAHEGAAALVVSVRDLEEAFSDGRCFYVEPVAETLARAERLVAEFQIALPPEIAALRKRAADLAHAERQDGPNPAARHALCLEARWAARRVAFRNPLLNFDQLLFVKRFTQETYPDVCLNHMPWVSRPGGDICVLTRPFAPDGAGQGVRNVLGGALGPGHVHGVDLWWDADRVVFGYAKAKTNEPPTGWLDRRTSYTLRRTEEPIHLFEIGVDGRGLRQLTRGQWSDLDPTYLPNGDIAFVSERCAYSLQCNEPDKDETSCNLYVMGPNGENVRRLSVSKDGDYLPHALDDGTIAYTRWEYEQRSWANIQSIWTIRPDGTGADAVFKQHFNDPWGLEDTRSIPGSRKLVAIATGHHTLPAGPLVVVNTHVGVNNPQGIRIVTPGILPPEGGMSGDAVPEGGVMGIGGFYMTPWALSEKHFLASYAYCDGRTHGPASEVDPTGYALYLLDVYGTKELIYRDPAISCFTPIPLRPRPRPPILPDMTDPAKPYAVCALSNATRGCDGVAPGAARYLRISQGIPWPYCNTYGGQRYEPDVKRVMVNWNPVRILGTVPIEPDGSAHFRVPVDEPVYFQLLDENHMELRRMRSFISFQPGESRACSGCHESQAVAPPARNTLPLALAREPVVPAPPPWGDRPISFLRDVQPVFDRHCVACHAGLKPAGGLDFSGGLTQDNNRAYDTILAARLVSRSNVGDDARITLPLAFGSHQSKLVHVLRDGPCAKRVKLTDDDWLRLVTWIDANGPYHDGFINVRPDNPPYNLAADRQLHGQIAAIHGRRCANCHAPDDVSRLDWIDIHRPRESLFLAAPLAKEASGTGKCKQVVYQNPSDPDYQAVLQLVRTALAQAWNAPRRDLKAIGGQTEVGASRRMSPLLAAPSTARPPSVEP